MTGKHTPGPWEAAIQHRCHAVIASISGEPKAVAIVGNNNPDDGNEPMRFANARLIAAAPDLLEVLRRLVIDAQLTGLDQQAGWDSFFAQAQEVIAKATGNAA